MQHGTNEKRKTEKRQTRTRENILSIREEGGLFPYPIGMLGGSERREGTFLDRQTDRQI